MQKLIAIYDDGTTQAFEYTDDSFVVDVPSSWNKALKLALEHAVKIGSVLISITVTRNVI